MRVGILGALEVTVAGARVDVPGARLRSLLIRLVLDPGRPVGTERLIADLWGDAPPTGASNALQSLVSRLRRLLPDDPVLLSVAGGYEMDLPRDAVDAHRFERLATEGRSALRTGDPATAARLLRDGLALWRGAALTDVADAVFAAGPAARWEELRLTATEDRIEAELRHGRPPPPVAELQELAAAHPLRERVGALLVKALYAAGRQADALATYEDLRRRLAEELGVDPSAELRDAHLAVLRGDVPVAAVTVHTTPRGNLRAALTSFVGRDEDLARVGAHLRDNRLVTLIGPGGAGKTRLAATAAADEAGGLDGGAWLVELAPVTEPVDVPQAVLHALDLREPALPEPAAPVRRRDAVTRLVDALSHTDALLVLDNCEHVLDAAARLAEELLSRCPRLRVLATSREPLGILGEAIFAVTALPVPEPGVSVTQALGSPAVQLLRDRAVAVRPGFAVTDGNIEAVVSICRRLDGLPLAIELAAARLRTLSPQAVAGRLGDRFRLLTGGSRTALPRHRTLHAVVAWSWELLTDPERLLAEGLAVFPATIGADSARGVCAGDGVPVEDVTDLLDTLVDKSLLQVVDDTHARYRMLETIREYGLERLAERGRVLQVRAAHAAYFLALVETAEPHLRTADQLRWFALLSAERENVLAALAFACDAGDADLAVRLCAGLGLHWIISGDSGEAAALLGLALGLPGGAPVEARVIATALHLGTTAMAGDYQLSPEEVAEFTELVGRLDPTTGHPFRTLISPALAIFTDDTAGGLAAIERGMRHPDPWARAMLLAMRGIIKENDGDADGMLHDLTLAVEGLRPIGERWALAMTLTSLADAQAKRGRFDAAVEALEEATRLVRELNPNDDAGFQLVWLASLRARIGDVEGARAALRECVAGWTSPAQGRIAAFALLVLGEIARLGGEWDEAADHYAAAWTRQAEAPLVAPQFRALVRVATGLLAVDRDELDDARAHLADALHLAVDASDMPVIARVAVGVAALAAAGGDPERAAAVLGASDALRGTPDRSDQDAERLTAALRERLGAAGFESAYARGHGLGRADALALADPATDGVDAQTRRR